jgi:hypothetical protein
LEEGSCTGDFESWMKGLCGWGISLSRGSVEGVSLRAPLLGNPKDEDFLKICKIPCKRASISIGTVFRDF